jgi:flagellar protein FlbD
VIKLTRLNNHIVAINPDHIGWADATPDTTLFMIGGEKIIVRETLDELIAQIVEFRRRVRMTEPSGDRLGTLEGDPPRFTSVPAARRASDPPGSIRARRSSDPPGSIRLRGGT